MDLAAPAAALRGPAPHAHRRRHAGDAGVRRGSAAQAWLIKPIIDDVLILTQPSSLQFVVVGDPRRRTSSRALGGYFSSYLMDDLGHRVVMRLRNELFRHLLDQSAAFFSRRTTGQLLSRINNDVGQVQRAVAETVGDLARESLALVGFAALLFYYDARPRAALHDRRAAGHVSARAARPAAAHGDAVEPGAARAHVARGRRGVHRPPHRQGVRRRGA